MDDRQSVLGIPDLRIVFDRVEADGEHEVGRFEQSIARLIAKQPHAADEVSGYFRDSVPAASNVSTVARGNFSDNRRTAPAFAGFEVRAEQQGRLFGLLQSRDGPIDRYAQAAGPSGTSIGALQT